MRAGFGDIVLGSAPGTNRGEPMPQWIRATQPSYSRIIRGWVTALVEASPLVNKCIQGPVHSIREAASARLSMSGLLPVHSPANEPSLSSTWVWDRLRIGASSRGVHRQAVSSGGGSEPGRIAVESEPLDAWPCPTRPDARPPIAQYNDANQPPALQELADRHGVSVPNHCQDFPCLL